MNRDISGLYKVPIMIQKVFFLFIYIILPLNYVYPIFEPISGFQDAYIKRISISSLDPNLIYIASKNSLYRSQDNLKTIKKLFVFKNEEVMHILPDPYIVDTVYVATSRHLYKIKDNKITKLFTCSQEETIYSATKLEDEIYIGTSNSLYVASEDILKWKKIPGLIDTSIYFIKNADTGLFLATDRGIYFFDKEHNIKRLLIKRANDGKEEETNITCTVIEVDLFDKERIWLGTTKGIYRSTNNGKDWERLYISSIDNLYINCFAQSGLEKDVLYVGTNKGLFKMNINKLEANLLSEGIHANQINWIQFNRGGEIYLATDKGLFKEEYFTKFKQISLEELLKDEPSIEEIQEAALRYNEVSPDKITKWRRMLKIRALAPTISWRYDKVIYGSSKGEFAVGPRDWGLSFSWNMADLIWNSYEDDVDTRSRLNTQLRLDILDEVNRIYFERLRLKQELLTSLQGKEEIFQKELRFKELTAMLDGYTGGYLSKRIKSKR
ncbi:MAG: hypothetical protein NC925_01500 [Candidatus Omnitrophica bacterium]|nr:hypothetical protein [Candidatus Omnitrophota bacterium]